MLVHAPEMIEKAVLLPDGCYVQLDDPLFEQHNLGPRYSVVQNAVVDGRMLSYALLDLQDTTYDLITGDENPRLLGAFDEMARTQDGALYAALDAEFKSGRQTKNFATRQQMALALIRADADGVTAADEVGVLRVVRWAVQYERRAWWICKHRLEAYAADEINWKALGM